jgi:surface polysaccharide O-acyltransferase-like enzyme
LASKPNRVFYIENLRAFVIVLVIIHHVAMIYSRIAPFYYTEDQAVTQVSESFFFTLILFQQSYFMGLMFLLAGFFTHGSLERKGFVNFIKDRFKRLVIPAVVYMLVITPFIEFLLLGKPFDPYKMLYMGVMWFAMALFAFSVVYALVRKFWRVGNQLKTIAPSFKNILLFILIIAVVAFLIRLFSPIGTFFLNFRICYFASYVALFIIGVVAKGQGLFDKFSYAQSKAWLIAALAGGLALLGVISGIASSRYNINYLFGGFHWMSFVYAVWESFVAVGMSIGLIGLFKEKFNRQNGWTKIICDNSFTVYMFHPPIVIAIAISFASLSMSPIPKWFLISAFSIPACFVLAHFLLRKIPLLQKLL